MSDNDNVQEAPCGCTQFFTNEAAGAMNDPNISDGAVRSMAAFFVENGTEVTEAVIRDMGSAVYDRFLEHVAALRQQPALQAAG